MLSKTEKSILLKKLASEHGFMYAGISKAEFMDEEARRLEAWLNKGMQGEMKYLENHFEKRVDPTKLVPGARTVVSLAYNYYTEKKQTDPEAPKIATYAFGKDYHKVVKKKLKGLIREFEEQIKRPVQGRAFVDSAPVLERDWAKRSGVGWIGKNTLLIHPKSGSFFFLAELIIDTEMAPDRPMKDYCGRCTRCIDACPTDAISEDGYSLDAGKCISYATIELKGEIPSLFSGNMEDYIFGCDICQDVCPWNRFSQPHNEPAFEAKEELLTKSRKEWEEITEEIFDKLFEGSAVKRTKFKGLKRNIAFLKRKKK